MATIDPKDFRMTDTKYQKGIILDTYNGFSIACASSGKDGTIWADWAFPQGPGKKPKETAVPVKVYLGKNAAEAIQSLDWIKAQLTGEKDKSEYQPDPPTRDDFDDLPF